jgi:hypothetical protein
MGGRRMSDTEDTYLDGSLTEDNRFAIIDLRVGSVVWGDIEPGYNRRPVSADRNFTVSGKCLIDTGANWSFVSRQVADNLRLRIFDGPPPSILGPPQKEQKPRPAAWITVLVGDVAVPVQAYIDIPPVSGDQYDALIGTNVLRNFRFTYDGPEKTFCLGPVNRIR